MNDLAIKYVALSDKYASEGKFVIAGIYAVVANETLDLVQEMIKQYHLESVWN